MVNLANEAMLEYGRNVADVRVNKVINELDEKVTLQVFRVSQQYHNSIPAEWLRSPLGASYSDRGC